MPLIHKVDHPAVEGIRVGRTTPNGGYRINTSCIVYRVGNTIVDAGPTSEWKTLKQYLSEREVKRALITHYHEDHSGNCGHIQDCFNSVIHSHLNNHDKLTKGFAQNWTSKMIFGRITLAQPQDLPESVEVGDNRLLKPIHTPGHTSDSTCYYEPNEGWLFSGDLYVSTQVRYAYKEESMTETIQSLNDALDLDFKELFCAHRGYIADGKQALRNKRDFLVSLQEEVRHHHQLGMSPKAIARKLLGREDSVWLFSGFSMSKKNLVNACLRT